jgi:TPR repeat protein
MKFLEIILLLMAISFSTSSYAKRVGSCPDTTLPTIGDMLRACQEIVKDKKKSDKDISHAAQTLGLLSKLAERPTIEAIGYFLISAEKGNLESYSYIGDIYRIGEKDLKVDYKKSYYYYKLDASLSFKKFKGIAYLQLDGLGIEQDVMSALMVFEMLASAKSTDSSIRSELSRINSDERYKLNNLEFAYFWAMEAVRAEEDAFRKGLLERDRIELESKLNAQQINMAKKLFDKCKGKSPSRCNFVD